MSLHKDKSKEKRLQIFARFARIWKSGTGCIDTDNSNWVTDVTGKPIAVPEAFFKAVLLHRSADARIGEHYEAHAWIVENRSYGFSGFEQKATALEISIDEIIVFSSSLPDVLREIKLNTLRLIFPHLL